MTGNQTAISGWACGGGSLGRRHRWIRADPASTENPAGATTGRVPASSSAPDRPQDTGQDAETTTSAPRPRDVNDCAPTRGQTTSMTPIMPLSS